jgi:magnesium chelatase subunit I
MDILTINTLGELKKSGYVVKSIKQEIRDNLIEKLQQKETIFKGVMGYDNTVIPEVERAILSRHNIILLGLRGQAKTRIARLMVNLLDEYIPVVKGSEINDDPLAPISIFARELIAIEGDKTPVEWLHRSERYTEKLATPDVSVADLIGDIDPIKAAANKLSFSDEKVIHFGLIPRSHRCIFVINELPDLQARIQVSLFNILQEEDIQIRGFKLRLPLDIQFLFTANPEDYTNRGSIVTPLKDRIESQILTHYPKSLDISLEITQQEARILPTQQSNIVVPALAKELIEQIAIEARNSEYVDAKSGVSARLTISAYENLIAAAERRIIINKEKNTTIRLGDFDAVIPSITGKIELVYEGEQEGSYLVAQQLIRKAIRSVFTKYFPDPSTKKSKKSKLPNTYSEILKEFSEGKNITLMNEMTNAAYEKVLDDSFKLDELPIDSAALLTENSVFFIKELILHGLAECSQITKSNVQNGNNFSDIMDMMMSDEFLNDMEE